jgi:hypothetical protein
VARDVGLHGVQGARRPRKTTVIGYGYEGG